MTRNGADRVVINFIGAQGDVLAELDAMEADASDIRNRWLRAKGAQMNLSMAQTRDWGSRLYAEECALDLDGLVLWLPDVTAMRVLGDGPAKAQEHAPKPAAPQDEPGRHVVGQHAPKPPQPEWPNEDPKWSRKPGQPGKIRERMG